VTAAPIDIGSIDAAARGVNGRTNAVQRGWLVRFYLGKMTLNEHACIFSRFFSHVSRQRTASF
jgi:hypothetical protein